jgi:hypothetical protein
MAGSLNHIVDSETGKFCMDLIENLGDAHEALEECFDIIRYLTKGRKNVVNRVLRKLNYPDIHADMKKLEGSASDRSW